MSILSSYKTALVFAPHTDDGEFGCGGTINRMVEMGVDVHYAAFSACRQSVLAEFPPDILVTEVKAATKQLGIEEGNVVLFDFEVRKFNYQRQAILDNVLELKNKLQPDLVFVPCLHDIHQDHSTLSNEVVRAFKFSSIFCYELPWNNFNFTTDCFIELEPQHLDAKIRALAEYRSQMHRPYANEEFVRSQALMRGIQSSLRFAEAFEIKRLII